jgi:hypothetical protein
VEQKGEGTTDLWSERVAVPAIEEETVKEEEGACVRQTRKARCLFLIQQVIFPTLLIPALDFYLCHMSHIQTVKRSKLSILKWSKDELD